MTQHRMTQHRPTAHRSTSRRALLGGLSAALSGAAVTATTGCATAAGTPPAARPTFVLVGGNGAPSFFWTPLVRALSLRGHRAHPVELPGHGLDAEFSVAYQAPQDRKALRAQDSRLGALTLADYGAAVADVVRRVRAHGPVILVGHSLGGATVTLAANSVHADLDRLVYISAICCTASKSALDYLGMPENRDSLMYSLPPNELGDPQRSGFTHTDFRTNDPRYLEAFRRATFAEGSQREYLAFLNFCNQPMESATASFADARGHAATWGRVPRSYVRLTDDRFITPPIQCKMIADADRLTPDNRFDVHELRSSHAGIVLHAERLADLLSTVAGQPARR